MFSKRTTEFSFEKSVKKFLNEKEVSKRIKHLNLILEKRQEIDNQKFISSNLSAVFFNFYESFSLLECDSKTKLTLSQWKEIEIHLLLFEKILLYVPEFIHDGYQYNCIYKIIENLLQIGNSTKVRIWGLRLFIIWYQILNAKSLKEGDDIYLDLLSEFIADRPESSLYSTGDKRSTIIPNSHRNLDVNNLNILPMENSVNFPADSYEENAQFELFQRFLRFTITESTRIRWVDSTMLYSNWRLSFNFLIEKMKSICLPKIFPELTYRYDMFTSCDKTNISTLTSDSLQQGCKPSNCHIFNKTAQITSQDRLRILKEEIIRWICELLYAQTNQINKKDADNLQPEIDPTAFTCSASECQQSLSDIEVTSTGASHHTSFLSRSSTKSISKSQHPKNSPIVSIRATKEVVVHINKEDGEQVYNEPIFFPSQVQEYSDSTIHLIETCLLSKGDNINLIHELIHFAFHLPLQSYKGIYAVLTVYKTWIRSPNSRYFYYSPSKTRQQPFHGKKVRSSSSDNLSNSLAFSMDKMGEDGVDKGYPLQMVNDGDLNVLRRNCYRTMIYNLASVFQMHVPDRCVTNISVLIPLMCSSQTGPQSPNGQSSNISSPMTYNQPLLSNRLQLETVSTRIDYSQLQVDLCGQIISEIFRSAHKNYYIDKDYLLDVILTIIDENLPKSDVPTNKSRWYFNSVLVGSLFQTLNAMLCYNTNCPDKSLQAWIKCQSVYSKYHHVKELILEWKKILIMTTMNLCKSLYGVNLDDNERTFRKRGDKRSSRRKTLNPPKDFNSPVTRISQLDLFIEESSFMQSKEKLSNVDTYDADDRGSQATSNNINLPDAFPKKKLISLRSASESNLASTDSGILDNISRSSRVIHTHSEDYRNENYLDEIYLDSGKEQVISDNPLTIDTTVNSNDPLAPSPDASLCNKRRPDKLFISPKLLHTASSALLTRNFTSMTHLTMGNATHQRLSHRHSLDGEVCHENHIPASLLEKQTDNIFSSDHSMAKSASNEREDDLGSSFFDECLDEKRKSSHASGICEGLLTSPVVSSPGEDMSMTKSLYSKIEPRPKMQLPQLNIYIILWQKFISLLGPINSIKPQEALENVYEILLEIVEIFIRARKLQSKERILPCRNNPSATLYCPPINYVLPTAFEQVTSLEFDNTFSPVRYLSLKCILKCMLRDYIYGDEPGEDELCMFYHVIKLALNSHEFKYIELVIKEVSSRMFKKPLPGSQILLPDLLMAIEKIISLRSTECDTISKKSSIILISQFISLSIDQHFQLDQLVENEENSKRNNLFDRSMEILIKSLKAPFNAETRCSSLTCLNLSMLLIASDRLRTPLLNFEEGLVFLLANLTSCNENVVVISLNCLRMFQNKMNHCSLAGHVSERFIVQSICYALLYFWPNIITLGQLTKDSKKLMIELLKSLLDWVLCLDLEVLLAKNNPEWLDFMGVQSACSSASILEVVMHSLNVIIHLSYKEKHPNTLTENLFDIENPLVAYAKAKRSVHFDQWLKIKEIRQVESDCPTNLASEASHESLTKNVFSVSRPTATGSIRLASRYVMSNIIHKIGQSNHSDRAQLMESSVQEFHDNVHQSESNSEPDSQYKDCLNDSSCQMIAINDSILISFITMERAQRPEEAEYRSMFPEKYVRVIIRDFTGKYCWDLVDLFEKTTPSSNQRKKSSDSDTISTNVKSDEDEMSFTSHEMADDLGKGLINDYLMSLGPDDELKDHEPQFGLKREEDPKIPVYLEDVIKRLLGEFKKSKTIRKELGRLDSNSSLQDSHIGEDVKRIENRITEQLVIETSYFHAVKNEYDLLNQQSVTPMYLDDVRKYSTSSISNKENINNFDAARTLLSYLGFLSKDHVNNFSLLQETDVKLQNYSRELKTMDERSHRETHKIGVIYIKEGQFDKQEFLLNNSGSEEYHEFIENLGTNVHLMTHKGFAGGLDKSAKQSNGSHAPYYSTPTLEVVFHVATQMPSNNQNEKVKHVGNDEVMIFWIERSCPFKKNDFRTDFGDVIIIVQPLANQLFHIQIIVKNKDVASFGPLHDNCLVTGDLMAELVRETAINAGRAVRRSRNDFREHFEERASYLMDFISKYKHASSFCDLIRQIFLPKVHAPPANSETSLKQIRSKSLFSANVEKSKPEPAKQTYFGEKKHSSTPKVTPLSLNNSCDANNLITSKPEPIATNLEPCYDLKNSITDSGRPPTTSLVPQATSRKGKFLKVHIPRPDLGESRKLTECIYQKNEDARMNRYSLYDPTVDNSTIPYDYNEHSKKTSPKRLLAASFRFSQDESHSFINERNSLHRSSLNSASIKSKLMQRVNQTRASSKKTSDS